MKAVLSFALVLAGLSVSAQAPTPKKTTPPPPPVVAATAKPAPAPTPVATGFVGNKDSKVFHTTACKIGAKIKAANKVTFASKDEAVKAGYKPCKVCIKA